MFGKENLTKIFIARAFQCCRGLLHAFPVLITVTFQCIL